MDKLKDCRTDTGSTLKLLLPEAAALANQRNHTLAAANCTIMRSPFRSVLMSMLLLFTLVCVWRLELTVCFCFFLQDGLLSAVTGIVQSILCCYHIR